MGRYSVWVCISMNTEVYGHVIGGGKKSAPFCSLSSVHSGPNSPAR